MFEIGGITFDVISLVYIVVALFYLIHGWNKGLFARFHKPFVFVAACFVGVLACKYLVMTVYNLGFMQSLVEKLVNWLGEQNEYLVTAEYSAENVALAIQSINAPEFLAELINTCVVKFGFDSGTMAVAIGQSGILLLAYGVVFLVGFIVGAIVLGGILKKILNLKKLSGGAFDKLLGLAYDAIGAILLISVVAYAMSFYISLNAPGAEWLVNQMALGDDTVKTLSKWVYDQNLLMTIINWVVAKLGL